jgi:K+/H+ antiporter YhaU regulatory subunit KhtT
VTDDAPEAKRAEWGMTAILSLLVVITFSILVTRIATVALTHTGLSRESARFQSRSALTGAGFTTAESESVVRHPVRRRIIMLLMLVGNAGIVTAVSALILGFVSQGDSRSTTVRIVVLIAGLTVLWTLAQSQWVDHHLSRMIDWALRRYTRLEVRDFSSLLRLTGDYRVVEIQIEHEDWLANRTLADTRLRAEGVVVLGIQRSDGTYIGVPTSDDEVRPHDVLLLYGRVRALERLDERRRGVAGQREHEEAVAEQERVAAEEARADARAREAEASATGGRA